MALLEHKLHPVCTNWRLALQDDTVASPLDTANGHYEPIIAHLASATPATVAAMSQAFAAVIAPFSTAPATRVKAGRNWHLRWALERGTLPQLLPMPTDVLLAGARSPLWRRRGPGSGSAPSGLVGEVEVA